MPLSMRSDRVPIPGTSSTEVIGATSIFATRYTSRLASVVSSIVSVGDSYDNAPTEMIIGLYKTKVICIRDPFRHVDTFEYVTLEWVDWFNHRGRLELVGNVSPAPLKPTYYGQQEGSALAA